jgi:hypothetical protein
MMYFLSFKIGEFMKTYLLRFYLILCFSIAYSPEIWTQPLFHPGDLIYKGAFRLPDDTIGGSRFGYGGTAPVYHPQNNSLFMVGHDWDQKVAEVSIPPLVIPEDIDDLNTAVMLQPFRDISEGLMYTVDDGTIKLGGMLISEGELIGSAWAYYDADGSQVLSHFSSDTNITITGDVEGMFELGTIGAGFVSGYMGHIPIAWQNEFGGPALTGQCCIPIISRSSYGPAAFVFDPADLNVNNPLPVTPLVYYPDEYPLAEWNSTGPLFNGTTTITGIVIPEDKRSVLFIGSHGIGEFCYGTGEDCNDPVNSYQGTHAYPYVYQIWAYDMLDLLDVKNGIADPWEVIPYATWNFDFPITDENKQIGGVAYDAETDMLYISQLRIDGFDAFPLVHAFKIRGSNLYVDSLSTGIGEGTSWASPFRYLQDALDIAHQGDTIHLAKGTYYPDDGASQVAGDRIESFHVTDSVVIYGGYPSGGGTRSPAIHKVVLSGDIDHNDLFVPATQPSHLIGSNAYHILTCENAVLDGVIISGGMANSMENVSHQSGAGIQCTGAVTIKDCNLLGNSAAGNGSNGKGGGLYFSGSSIVLRNVLFNGNLASLAGSAFYTTSGSVVVSENVIVQD